MIVKEREEFTRNLNNTRYANINVLMRGSERKLKESFE